MFAALIKQFFSWLPASLWVPVWAVFAVAMFIVVIKFLSIVLDWVFKFIDIFLP